jgi:hypothetical protein
MKINGYGKTYEIAIADSIRSFNRDYPSYTHFKVVFHEINLEQKGSKVYQIHTVQMEGHE